MVFGTHLRKIFLLAMVILLAIAGFLFFAGLRISCLVLEIPETGEIVWAAPLGRDEQFQLRYIHSVDLLPVYETYICKDMRLVLTGTRFLSWGAGLGYMGEGILTEENGWTIIKAMQRQVGAIPLRVGTIAEHTLLYRGKNIRLRNYVPAQTLVHIRIKKVFPFKLKLQEEET
jgi:hypothetical protein